jgi:hypothetical protein
MDFSLEKAICARLFAIIARQGKTSAATALFKSMKHVRELADVPWSDIDWYANHPNRESISSMYSNLGFPNRKQVESLENWVRKNSDHTPSSYKKLFSSVTGMQNGRGMPKTTELDDLKDWCIKSSSQESWLSLLSSVTGMQNGRGMPKLPSV